ncbi:MAG: dihydroxyacetone kinase subunit L [Firmicutes bacterium HGW-Firmicutes-1]|jgi:dihydroxyacetone kinase-like protein|nr:MAG: dihydroxyacetone kinase subunit L [Firmicutes bacterium HGW-Firmicutes-1]
MEATMNSFIKCIEKAIEKNTDFLTSLDGAIGDADHGINMKRGFNAVALKVTDEDTDIGITLKKVGMTLLSTVGGASGPLYGTAFIKAGIVAQGKTVLDGVLVEKMLLAAISGIKEKGKATKGEKTMVDALEPAYESIKLGIEKGHSLLMCLESACQAAQAGVEFTKTIKATKGRASYLGDRSIGHQDPGATSSLIILKAVTNHYKQCYK